MTTHANGSPVHGAPGSTINGAAVSKRAAKRTVQPPARPLLLVSVGTDVHPFDRLIKWVDGWLDDGGADRVRAIVQYGNSVSSSAEGASAYLSFDELQIAMRDAAVVICHGGPATIVECRRRGHLPIVVPRDERLGEHVDGHQRAFATEMGRRGDIVLADSEAALRSALDRALVDPDAFRVDATQDDRTAEAVQRLGSLIDELVEAGNTKGSARRAGTSGPTLLYLGGLGRSGSTLLDRMLGQVPGVFSMGEIVHLWERGLRGDERCGCGQSFSTCAFWSEVGRRAFGGWDKLRADDVIEAKYAADRNRFIPALLAPGLVPGFRQRVSEYGQLVSRLYTAVAEVSGARVLVDSSKHSSFGFLLRQVPGLDLRVVHVIRDSRGVAYSWSKRVRKPEIVETDEFMPVYSPLKSAMLWNVHNGLFETLAATGVPSMRVRYEDLLRSTETEIARVLHFAGLDPDPEAMAFLGDGSVELGVNHTVAGNPMRFTTGQLALRTDEAWRNAMPAPRRRAVSALTAPLRMAYGYTARNDQARNQPSDAVETPR